MLDKSGFIPLLLIHEGKYFFNRGKISYQRAEKTILAKRGK